MPSSMLPCKCLQPPLTTSLTFSKGSSFSTDQLPVSIPDGAGRNCTCNDAGNRGIVLLTTTTSSDSLLSATSTRHIHFTRAPGVALSGVASFSVAVPGAFLLHPNRSPLLRLETTTKELKWHSERQLLIAPVREYYHREAPSSLGGHYHHNERGIQLL